MQTVTETNRAAKSFEAPDTKAKLTSAGARWFAVTLILLFVVITLLFMLSSANSRAEKAPEVRWVMLYPNGEWRVQFTPPASPQQFFNQTIDNLLTDYLEYRHQQIPQTIRNDYGRATVFMSKAVQREFISPEGFNAVEKAGVITTSKSPELKRINVIFFDHQDIVSDAVFRSGKKPVIRTTAYIDEEILDQYGNKISNPVRKIINLTWTLKTPKELRNEERKFFIVNPIGLEILSERVTVDSVYNSQN